jgi:hypothetical protein
MRVVPNLAVSCSEHDQLERDLAEARTRGRNLSRLRQLSPRESAALDQREQTAFARLRDHDMDHRCNRN